LKNYHSTLNIAAFLLGQGVATLGAFIVSYSIIWHVTLETKSGVSLALLSVAQSLPMFFVSPVAGVIADRYNRRKVAIIADSFVALATLGLALFLNAISANLAVLLVVVLIRAIGQGFQQPVMMAIVPLITPQKHLVRVNGIMDTMMSVNMLAAPALAAALLTFTSLGNICLITVAASAVGIALMVFVVKVPDVGEASAVAGVETRAEQGTEEESIIVDKSVEHEVQGVSGTSQETERTGFVAELIGGFKYIRHNPFVLRMMALLFVVMFCVAPAANLGPLLIVRNWGDNTFYLSVSEMAFSIGMLVGGVLILAWGGFKNRTVTYGAATALIALLHFGFGLSVFVSVWLFIATFAICGVAMPFWNTPAISLTQAHTDEQYMGRVMSVSSMAMGLGQPISTAIFGPLSDVIDINWIMVSMSIPLLICAAFIFKSKVLMSGGVVADEG
jgi:DHA3 family macrolide efflux protein-like MFS transporter